MKPKLAIVFLILVLLPLVLLGGLGYRLAVAERENLQRKYEQLLLEQLAAVKAAVVEITALSEESLNRALDVEDYETLSLRNAARGEPLITQVFLVDRQGHLLYPSTAIALNAVEEEFLEITQQIWIKKELPFFRNARFSDDTSSVGASEVAQQGWSSAAWGSGFEFFFWQKDATGDTLGAWVNRARLISDLIVSLPATEPGVLAHGRIALIDSADSIVYQWGFYEPGEGETYTVSMLLDAPFAGWKLAYFPEDRFTGASQSRAWFYFFPGLMALGLGLAALALYFYRENSREMRLARERVTFVNQVSHELKTPLTNIRMYAELLEQSIPLPDEKVKKYLNIMVSEIQRLSRLIGNILTFGRQQRKQLRVYPTEGIVDQIIEAVIDSFRPRLVAKHVKIVFRPGAGAKTRFDHDVLEQILGNLISNVEKYGASGGLLEVESQQIGQQTRVSVLDRGPGIPPRQRERVFEPFYRLSSRLTDGVTGAGIGLSIARDLARLHGGDLRLLDCEQGACFELTLFTPATEE